MFTKKSFRLSKGFTLVELLVVIAIIGVLATMLLLQLGVARQRARDAKRITDVAQTRTAIEQYFDDNGFYPQVGSYAALGGVGYLVPKYMTQLPADSLNVSPHIYRYSYLGFTKYQISAVLEQWAQAMQSDTDINSTTGGWQGEPVNGTADAKTDCTTPSTTACIYDQGQG